MNKALTSCHGGKAIISDMEEMPLSHSRRLSHNKFHLTQRKYCYRN